MHLSFTLRAPRCFRRTALLMASLMAFTACQGKAPQSTVVFPGEAWLVSTPEAQGLSSEKLEAAMTRIKEISGKQGNDHTLVILNGYLIWQGSKIDEQIMIYSTTKSLTSAAIGLLWDDGKLSPDSRIAEFVPGYRKDYPSVTIEQVGTFTSGIDFNNATPETPGEPMFRPGTAFHYSNQTNLLSYITTKITGQSMRDFFQERIGDPIGMRSELMDWNTFSEYEGVEVNTGATGAHVTARELARFAWLVCQGGVWDGERLLSQRYLDYATQPLVSPNIPMHDPEAWYSVLPGRYGFNWWVNGKNADGKWLWSVVSENAFMAQGNKNNNAFILPDWNMVIIRLGSDKIISIQKYDEAFALIEAGFAKQ